MAAFDEFKCENCGHAPSWHRLDDALNIAPTDPAAKFRCLGSRFDGCNVGCPDFVAPPGYIEAIEAASQPTTEDEAGRE